MKYRYADCQIDCTFALPELQEPEPAEKHSAIRITLAPDEYVPAPTFTWTDTAGATVLGHVSADEADYLIFPGICAFAIAGDHIRTIPVSGIDEGVRHCLLDQVLPRMLSREQLALHGAAVVPGCSSAIVLLGPSGAGKSTLATYASLAGANILADDCIFLSVVGDTLYVSGSYPGSRLNADARAQLGIDESRTAPFALNSDKRRVAISRTPHRTLPQSHLVHPVAAIVFLKPGENAICTAPASGAAAAMAVGSQLFVMNPGDPEAMRRHFLRLGEAMKADLRLVQCTFPHRFEQLPQLWSRVMTSLSS